MPDLGEGVSEGEIISWMLNEGDFVKESQPLLEVMTDKVNVVIPSPRTGKIVKIMVKQGELAKVGTAILLMDDGNSEPTVTRTQEAPLRLLGHFAKAEQHVRAGDIDGGVLALFAFHMWGWLMKKRRFYSWIMRARWRMHEPL